MTISSAVEQRQTIDGPVREWWRREPIFAGGAICLAALIVPTLIAMALDPRTLLGVSVWVKPLKFLVALTVYLATLAWFAGWLPKGTTRTLWYRSFSVIVVACIAAEMLWIGGYAAIGEASHFNISTEFSRTIYGLMGILAVVLTSATVVYAALIAFNRESTLDPVFRLSVVAGLTLTLVLTAYAGSVLASGTGHHVGTEASDAGGLPIFGWSRTGGDLRVAHFFATHAMHFIPVVGWLAARSVPRAPGYLIVLLSAGGLASLVWFTLQQALQGRPFL